MDVFSIFSITDLRTGKEYSEAVEGDGQKAINILRRMKDIHGKLLYPQFSKIILEGFEVDGVYSPLYLRSKRKRW